MDFDLTLEQRRIQAMAHEVASEIVAPRARSTDETGAYPWDAMHRLGKLGLLGIPIPIEYGGMGGDTVSYALAVREIARAGCGSTAISMAAHTSLGSTPLLLFGSAEQKRTYLVPLAQGEMIGAFALTEPEAGSDAGGVCTAAHRDGDDWVIDGDKCYITSGSVAGLLIVAARTDPASAGTNKGISMILVPQGTPGFQVLGDDAKMGLNGSATSRLRFDRVHVPGTNLVGRLGHGFAQFLQTLDGGRISIAALAIGLAEAAYTRALDYARRRNQFGQPIAGFQAIQWMLADMDTQINAALCLMYTAAQRRDAGKPYTKEAAQAKLFASEMAERVCHDAIQILGGYGYLRDGEVERIYRDVRLLEIGEGTSQIQRIVIARQILNT